MKYTRMALLLATALLASGCDKIKEFLPPDLPPAPVVKEAKWLNQNWSQADRHWFHHATQGTSTFPIPYSWFVALEQPEITIFSAAPLLRDETYLSRFGFIPSPRATPGLAAAESNRWGQKVGEVNPDMLPVGFARTPGYDDPATGRKLPDQIGLTCAACHTGHLEYKGVSLRFDGGTAPVDFGKLQTVLGLSLAYTKYLPFRFGRFADRVLGPNHTSDQKAELKAQLDALIVAGEALSKKMKELPGTDAAEGFARLDALTRIGNAVFVNALIGAKDAPGFDPWQNFARISAPVKFPHTWNTSWFDWVQYDASIMQPMVRNAGEALGVAAKINLTNPGRELYASSVQVGNIHDMEEMLAGSDPLKKVPGPDGREVPQGFNGLLAPKWPEKEFGAIDPVKRDEGRKLYRDLCQGCHLPPVNDPDGEFWSDKYWTDLPQATGKYLKVTQVPISVVGTDPGQADILQNRSVTVPPYVAIDYKDPCAPPSADAAQPVTTTSFAAALGYTVQRATETWYLNNKIPPEVQEEMNGNRANCLQAKAVYKARPLDGIWAVPPFLHNGSVPTLHDLLLPAAQRPKSFCLGGREYDPKKLGYEASCAKGTTVVDTTVAGSLNTGHEFKDGPKGNGIIGRALSEAERMALLEYLKSL